MEIIGVYTNKKLGIKAELMDNLSWRCSDPDFLKWLRILWPLSFYEPSQGYPGFMMLGQVKEAVGSGTVKIVAVIPDEPEGVIPKY